MGRGRGPKRRATGTVQPFGFRQEGFTEELPLNSWALAAAAPERVGVRAGEMTSPGGHGGQGRWGGEVGPVSYPHQGILKYTRPRASQL